MFSEIFFQTNNPVPELGTDLLARNRQVLNKILYLDKSINASSEKPNLQILCGSSTWFRWFPTFT
jgi:hypothetical protein